MSKMKNHAREQRDKTEQTSLVLSHRFAKWKLSKRTRIELDCSNLLFHSRT